jgi:hypothetical protein
MPAISTEVAAGRISQMGREIREHMKKFGTSCRTIDELVDTAIIASGKLACHHRAMAINPGEECPCCEKE